MNEIFDYLKSQPLHILVLYAALAVGVLMLLIVVPEIFKRIARGLFTSSKRSKTTSAKSTSKTSRYTSKAKTKFSSFSKNNKKAYSSKERSSSKQGRFGFFKSNKNASASKMRKRSINGYEDKSRSDSGNNLGSKLDFLSSQDECITKFKHGKVTDYYKELRKAGPASNLKEKDVDELDKIFTVMLKAGAVKKKSFLVTDFEHQYLEKLRLWFGDRYEIYCQVSVGSALGVNPDVSSLSLQDRRTFAQKCHNMSFDFMLIEKGTDRIACVIELDDPTHFRSDRKARDRRLDKVCAAAELPIFHITAINQKPDLKGI